MKTKKNDKSANEYLVESKISTKKSTQIEKDDFPIVGIGASAGGLEALEQFFTNMPKGNGMAFVVIQHLDPNHKGIMPELLQRITNMKVFQASDRLKVKPNRVYVIPPNKSLSLLNGILYLFDSVKTQGLRLPIDYFFRSLADDRQEKSIGIILSGMGSDGSLGLKAIKEKGGLVLVQTPSSAKYEGMPQSAADAVTVDVFAPANELPAKLMSFLKFIPKTNIDENAEIKYKSNLEKIVILLRENSGHDFSMYKKNTLFRRIERRKGVHKIDKIHDYVRFLQGNPAEIEILFKELLIGVTSFFRDTAVWEMLEKTILPELIAKTPDGEVIRAWVPACSTGEEAYSLAIVFKEAMGKMKVYKNVKLQIFATDLDNDAVEKARKGFFTKNITSDVSPNRLNQFFIAEGEGYRMNSTIREMIVFAPQNVIKDAPFTKLDILSCRNMLIYMEAELQQKLMALFNYSLKPGGIMLLGTSETPGPYTEGFKERDPKLKIFERVTLLKTNALIDFPSSFHYPKPRKVIAKTISRTDDNIEELAKQILLQYFAPASVLVNDKGDIIYITGRTGQYLEPVAGKANWNIYAMAREGLHQVLPRVFRKVMNSNDKVTERNIKIDTNGGNQFVNVTAQRIEYPNQINGVIVFVFQDVPVIIEHKKVNPKNLKRTANSREDELETELKRTNEILQSTQEEMQTSQEELKSTNEELQSTNEELQSTNEELTTSKEEMQSLNEELQTLNIEMQGKINEYVRANDDMKNLLNSIDIATLFLDKGLNIRRFTDKATAIFKLRITDIGRPFTDLVNDLNYPDIDEHARNVMKTLSSIETDVSAVNGKWFRVRIMPYRTVDDRIDGLVITFTDISAAKKSELELIKVNELLMKNKKA